MNGEKVVILCNDSIVDLASEIAQGLTLPLSQIVETRFADTEEKVKISENVRGHEVFYIHGFKKAPYKTKDEQVYARTVSDACWELLLVNDALKRADATKVTNILPDLAYARGDRKDESRVAIATKLMADVLKATGVSRVMTMDLHADQTQACYDCPFDNLPSEIMLANYIHSQGYRVDTIGAPDFGAANSADDFAVRLNDLNRSLGGLEVMIIQKKRPKDENGTPIPNTPHTYKIIGDVEGKHVLFYDDLIDTAGTLVGAARSALERGALSVSAAATHGVFSFYNGTSAEEKLFQDFNGKPLMDRVIVTNTIHQELYPGKEVVSVADVFARAIKCAYRGESVSEVFK